MTLAGGYLGGLQSNDFEFNPVNWDWSNQQTYFGIGTGLISGFAYGKALESSINFKKQINKLYTNVRDYPALQDGTLVKSDETLNSFSEKVFPKYKYRDKGRLQYAPEKITNKKASAVTSLKGGFVDGKINIYFSDNSFSSKWTLFNDMGHEYVHLANYIELGKDFVSVYSEYAAYSWNALVGGNESWIKVDFMREHGAKFDPFTLDGNVKVQRVVKPNYMRYGTYGLFTRIPEAYWNF